MSVLDTPENVPVQLGFCPCLGEPHPGGDIVYLVPALHTPLAVKARSLLVDAINGLMPSEEVQERLVDIWLRVCVTSWTFLDDEGGPIPVTPDNVVRALPYTRGGREVADKADDLYAAGLLNPLAAQLGIPLPTGSPDSSRPATSRNRPSTRKRPRRSSTATTDKAPPPG